MRSVVLQVFDYSFDGIIGEENTEFDDYCRGVPDDPAYTEWLMGSLKGADVHIMGRVMFKGMSEHFSAVCEAADADPEERAIAEILKSGRKVVFSRTLTTADWPNTTIMSGDLTEQLDVLRNEGDGEILAHGGVSFVQNLARLDLADEYRLTVFPYVAGTGQRLFSEATTSRPLELASCTEFADGVVAMVYRRRRQPLPGSRG